MWRNKKSCLLMKQLFRSIRRCLFRFFFLRAAFFLLVASLIFFAGFLAFFLAALLLCLCALFLFFRILCVGRNAQCHGSNDRCAQNHFLHRSVTLKINIGCKEKRFCDSPYRKPLKIKYLYFIYTHFFRSEKRCIQERTLSLQHVKDSIHPKGLPHFAARNIW